MVPAISSPTLHPAPWQPAGVIDCGVTLARNEPLTVERRAERPHVLSETLFSRVLIAERRRADRADHPLVVMILSAAEHRGGDASRLWREATEAVAAHTRETDVMGWLAGRTAIGIILHEVHAPDAVHPRELEVRLRRELARRFDADTVARFSIHLHVHANRTAASAPEPIEQEEPEPVDRSTLLEPTHRRSAALYDGLKRLFDIVMSATLLALLAPLLLLIAALVKLKSPGPVLFRQVRVGRMMKPFEMLKFRTMYLNVDHSLHHAFVSQFINAGTQDQQSGSGKPGFFKLVNDPRITPIGAVLRKTSLDELPQLWNVLRGEMSLVGPRPALPYEVEQYKRWHTRRVFEAKPGITGLWQVGGRSRTTFDDMVRLDLRYAKARSLWIDVKILLATPAAVFTGKGAC
jgi:lipopolysaccharide/colanic/teichoic acid biosynthesis glycosyltransferase